jgi:hypothetical protein
LSQKTANGKNAHQVFEAVAKYRDEAVNDLFGFLNGLNPKDKHAALRYIAYKAGEVEIEGGKSVYEVLSTGGVLKILSETLGMKDVSQTSTPERFKQDPVFETKNHKDEKANSLARLSQILEDFGHKFKKPMP